MYFKLWGRVSCFMLRLGSNDSECHGDVYEEQDHYCKLKLGFITHEFFVAMRLVLS